MHRRWNRPTGSVVFICWHPIYCLTGSDFASLVWHLTRKPLLQYLILGHFLDREQYAPGSEMLRNSLFNGINILSKVRKGQTLLLRLKSRVQKSILFLLSRYYCSPEVWKEELLHYCEFHEQVKWGKARRGKKAFLMILMTLNERIRQICRTCPFNSLATCLFHAYLHVSRKRRKSFGRSVFQITVLVCSWPPAWYWLTSSVSSF